tara:strand:+ start:463 stop:855 length:393 start_codon:yes stop_codon:yes gene_type:complete
MKDEDWVDSILEKWDMSFIDGDYRDYKMKSLKQREQMEGYKKQYDPRMRYAELEHMQNTADNPPHYTKSKIQPLEVIMDWELDFPLGNIVKLVRRLYEKDTPLQNLYKMRKYLNEVIEKEEKKFIESDPH